MFKGQVEIRDRTDAVKAIAGKSGTEQG